eukprot:Tamp_27669.p1 GENE.Tamp_27669~~Tamp_27669.p1  ORF type:complete len:187 (+),score=18.67 Tamp_27669:85-561(+)
MSACASDGSETRKPRAARGRDPYTYTYLGLALAAAVTLGCALLRQRQRRAQHAWTSRARLAYLLYPNLMPGRRVLCVEAEDFWRLMETESLPMKLTNCVWQHSAPCRNGEQVIVVSKEEAGLTHEHDLVAIAVIDGRHQVRLSEVDFVWHGNILAVTG